MLIIVSRLCSRTGVILLIFHLLLWDITFDDIPRAFETPYQLAPLDLSEDLFYPARQSRISERLKDIEDGGAKAILETNYQAQRAKKPCCAGLSWDICGSDELFEIVEVRL